MLSNRINRAKIFEKQAVPLQVTFEVTNACNYYCYFCAHDKMTRPVKFMDFTTGKKYLQDLYDSGVKEIGFNGCGEPVLNKNIAKFVNFAKKLGYIYILLLTVVFLMMLAIFPLLTQELIQLNFPLMLQIL